MINYETKTCPACDGKGHYHEYMSQSPVLGREYICQKCKGRKVVKLKTKPKEGLVG